MSKRFLAVSLAGRVSVVCPGTSEPLRNQRKLYGPSGSPSASSNTCVTQVRSSSAAASDGCTTVPESVGGLLATVTVGLVAGAP